ncbi:MAG: glycosyltransferase family 2 protein [Acidobacteria bacterium]|nr:glycosyltransferase family 2 protein [Acidobacteriota bacterium]
MSKPSLSVVVPVYQGAATVAPLVKEVNLLLAAQGIAGEIILVNDGSPDDSWDRIREIAAATENVRGVNLLRNYGQHNALLCGIRMAAGDIIVTMDDDLQHPPAEITKLLAGLGGENDVVYGTPREETHGLWRDLASRLTKTVLSSAMGTGTAKSVSAFRAFRTQLRDGFAGYQGPFVCIDVLLSWSTGRIASVEVRQDPRRHGVSNYTFRKLLVHALNMLTGFSVLPLRIASIIGFCFTFFGLLVLGYVVIRYLLNGGSVPGFSFLASTIAIFSGAQMFALGIIGEYLARIHFRSMDRPPYVISEVVAAAAQTGEPR